MRVISCYSHFNLCSTQLLPLDTLQRPWEEGCYHHTQRKPAFSGSFNEKQICNVLDYVLADIVLQLQIFLKQNTITFDGISGLIVFSALPLWYWNKISCAVRPEGVWYTTFRSPVVHSTDYPAGCRPIYSR